jgi:hypothetical protein
LLIESNPVVILESLPPDFPTMAADTDRANPRNVGRDRSREEAWSTRAHGLFVLASLAILVGLLAFLCTLHRTSRLEERLQRRLDHGEEVTEPSPSSRAREGVP